LLFSKNIKIRRRRKRGKRRKGIVRAAIGYLADLADIGYYGY
jgi:hypothetical protein